MKLSTLLVLNTAVIFCSFKLSDDLCLDFSFTANWLLIQTANCLAQFQIQEQLNTVLNLESYVEVPNLLFEKMELLSRGKLCIETKPVYLVNTSTAYSNCSIHRALINLLTPNDPYMGITAPLTSKRCILYIYSTNIGTEYFQHALHSPFFLQNAVCFIMLTFLGPLLFTFYIQGVLKLKKIIPAPKG